MLPWVLCVAALLQVAAAAEANNVHDELAPISENGRLLGDDIWPSHILEALPTGGGRKKREEQPNSANVTQPMDKIMDFVISMVVHKYGLKNGFQIPLRDMTKGSLRLSNGTCGDLRYAYRAEPLRLRAATVDGQRALYADFAAGLRRVAFRYRWHYQRAFIKNFGDVQGSISPVIMRGQVLLKFPCSVHLLALGVERLGPLQLSGTGFGPLNAVVYDLVSDGAGAKVREAIANVTQRIRRHVADELAYISCPEFAVN